MPGLKFLQQSAAKWRSKASYRRDRVIAYDDRAKKEKEEKGSVTKGTKWRAAMWRRRYNYALRMVSKRKKQITAHKSTHTSATGARAEAIGWWNSHLGHVEHPAGSNGDPGSDSISAWQASFGFGRCAWCGIFVGKGLRAAGVPITSRVASVSAIEDDARAGRNGFRAWRGAQGGEPGDVLVLFGRGVHTEGVIEKIPGGYLTDGGNTSSGNAGSQSNGGGSFRRTRPFGAVRGVAVPAYPN